AGIAHERKPNRLATTVRVMGAVYDRDRKKSSMCPTILYGRNPDRSNAIMTIPTLIGRTDAVVARVERKTYSPYARLPRHVHPDATIVCVVAGGFTERLGRHSFECSPGTVLMRGPDQPHANDCGPRGARCVAISVSAERLSSDPLVGKLFAEPSVVSSL